MPWTDPATIPHAVDNPVASTALLGAMLDDLTFLFQNNLFVSDVGGAPIIPNNSFEQDPNGTDGSLMTSWKWTPGTGGTGTVVNTDQNHGGQSFKMTQDTVAGHTAGILEQGKTSPSAIGFSVVSPDMTYQIRFMLKCSRTDVKNQVIINWYDQSQTFLSSTTVYTIARGSSPTAWTTYVSNVLTPPAGAFYSKIQLQGGQDTGTPPGATTSIFWDGIFIGPYPPFYLYSSFTATTTFTVPAGRHFIRIRAWGARSTNTHFGGYAEITERVSPGLVVTITIIGGSVTVVTDNTLTANAATPTADGTASTTSSQGPAITGASLMATARVEIYY